MKNLLKYTLIISCLFIFPGMVFAYSIKIFNHSGEQIGTAHKTGEDYEIYDMSGKKVTDYDSFYSEIDTPSLIHSPDVYPAIPGRKWVGVGSGVNLKMIKNREGQKFKVVRTNPYYTNSVNIKVYDRTGKFIGYAKTDGTTDYIIYDEDGNVLNINIPLYSPPGKPLESYWERYRGQRPFQE